MLDACAAAGVKMAVAHQGRLHPATLHTQELVRRGEIGKLRLIRGYGKLDHRGGGEDLMVLGTHILDMMRLYGGDAKWVSADLLTGSRLAGPGDVREGGDEIGPIAGDGLRATIGFEDDVIGMFESFAQPLGRRESLRPRPGRGRGDAVAAGGVRQAAVQIRAPLRGPRRPLRPLGARPRCRTRGPAKWRARGTGLLWIWSQLGNQRLVLDLLAAVEEDREPLGSGRAGQGRAGTDPGQRRRTRRRRADRAAAWGAEASIGGMVMSCLSGRVG